MRGLWLGYLLLAAGAIAPGQDAKEPDKRATDFTLPNGLRFVIMERHQAPLISFQTYIGGGTVNDPAGQSGLVRVIGRMSFKGSEGIGSRNWAEERKALDAMDEAYERMEVERNKGGLMKQEQYDTLRSQWRLAVDAASRLGDPGEYAKVLAENGVSGVHATASWYSIQAGYTLPSNRLELWFSMESQRLMHPVLRDFDKEREAAVEEQTKAQSNGQTRVLDALLAGAFTTHPYRVPAGGWASDLPELRRSEAKAYVEKHYVPGNIVLAMVGDVDPAEARRLAEKYFAAMPAKPMPAPLRTTEPAQQGPRTVELNQPGQSLTAIGYKRPGYFDKDDVALDVLQGILGNGTSGMAWRELIQDKKVAAALQVVAAYPDGHDPNLFLFFIAPAPGQPVDAVQKGVDDMLAHLRSQKVGLDVLNEAKAQAQAAAYQRLTSNATLAEMLAIHSAVYGDWRKLFSLIDGMAKVNEDDILRVAQRYLIPANRTTVFTAIPGMPARAVRSGALQ